MEVYYDYPYIAISIESGLFIFSKFLLRKEYRDIMLLTTKHAFIALKTRCYHRHVSCESRRINRYLQIACFEKQPASLYI